MDDIIAYKRRELLELVREEVHKKRGEVERLNSDLMDLQDELEELHRIEDALSEG